MSNQINETNHQSHEPVKTESISVKDRQHLVIDHQLQETN